MIYKSFKKSLIVVSIIAIFLFSSSYLFAYDETIVHPSLTEEMAKFYNKNFEDNELTKDEIRLMRKGSTDEDINIGLAARSANHFYNPPGITKWVDNTAKGEIVPETILTAKEWAHDSAAQATSPGGDFTWERAINDYASGNKERAYIGLGHILHLIEDMAVPAHVRSDLHISPKEFEAKKDTYAGKIFFDYEPYETWTGNQAKSGNLKFNFAESLFNENKKPVILNNLNGYFDEMATYTNTRFFSKDTVYTYSQPNNNAVEEKERIATGKVRYYLYGFDENGQRFKLARNSEDINNGQIRIYEVSDKTPEIHSDYWSRLAPKSILIGAGVIKLFKQEAEKAAGNYKPTTLSWLNKYPYGLAAWTAESGGTIARNGMTVSILARNSAIYGAKQIGALVSNLITSAYDKISYSLAPSASSNYTLVFDMSQAIPASSVTLLGGVIQVQAAKDTASIQPQILQEPVYSAALVSQSEPEIIIEPNKEINLSARFKNTGTAHWQQDKIYLNVYLKNDVANQFYHSSWLTPIRPAKLADPQVALDSFGNFNFLVGSPPTAGDYFFKARPVWQDNAGNFNWLGDSIVSWRIKVKSSDVARPRSEPRDKNSENIADTSQDKGQDTNTSTDAQNNTVEENQTPSKNEDDIKKGNEAKEADKNKESQDSAGNTGKNNTDNAEIAVPVVPTPLAPFYRRARDIYPPETTIIENPAAKTSANTASFKFASSEVDSTFLCNLDSVDFASCGENVLYENLSDGSHILKIKAIDRFNNIDETPAEFSWTIDSAPPAKITNLAAVAGGARGKIKLSWTKPENNVLYEIRYSEKEIMETGATENQTNWQDAVKISEAINNNAEQIEIGSATQFSLGRQYYFAIKTADDAGNISEISNSPSLVANAEVNHIVISEIKLGGATATDEFVELYNPTNSAVNLSGWRLTKKTDTGLTTNNLLTSFPDKTIPAHSYFLITHPSGYMGSITADAVYSTSYSMAADNTIILYSDAGNTIVDLIGMGSAANYEGATIGNPSDNGSLERKANYSSTAESMSGGADTYLGNAWDSDNNSADFVLRSVSDPQNSQSPVEPIYAPEKISDFSVIAVAGNSHTIKLIWTAPYGNFGNPEKLFYDIRYSTNEITAQNFGSAYSVFGITPLMRLTFIPVKAAGGAQELTIEGLSLGKTYYFAIKTTDITRNIDRPESEISFASYSFPAPNIQIFLQNLEKSYFGSSTNLGSNSLPPNVWPQVSQTIGRGFDQRLIKATTRVKCNSASACNVSFKAFYLSAYSDSGYTNRATGNNGFSSSGGLDNDPSSVPAGADIDVNFSGWPSFMSILNPVYYYKITFQFWTADPVQWGGSTQDSYANGKSIIEDYPGGADLYFKLYME